MKITVKIPPPHSDIQRTVYRFLADKNGPRFLFLSCGTKFGKTFSGAGALALAAPNFRNAVLRWVAPVYSQTHYGLDYIRKILPGKPYTEFNKSKMALDIISTKSKIEFWHGQKPEDLEGARVVAQVNDEAAKLKQQVWDSCTTTWTMTKAKVINMSTPRGKNWFYRGCMRAKEEELAAKKEGRVPIEIFRTAPTSANPYVPLESIAEAKRTLPSRLFEQYYNAVFVDDATTFGELIVDSDLSGGQLIEQTTDRISWCVPDAANRSVVVGQDWAKKVDFSCTVVIDINTFPFKIVGVMRLPQGIRYTDQVIELVRYLKNFKEVEEVYHDKTGVGEAIDDLLDKVPNLVYKGITFSNTSKSKMVTDLITGTEKKEIHFPNCPPFLDEMKEYEVRTNELGNMFFSAPEGQHDDFVSACMLAYAAATQHSSNFEVQFLDDISLPQKSVFDQYIEDALDIDIDEGF